MRMHRRSWLRARPRLSGCPLLLDVLSTSMAAAAAALVAGGIRPGIGPNEQSVGMDAKSFRTRTQGVHLRSTLTVCPTDLQQEGVYMCMLHGMLYMCMLL